MDLQKNNKNQKKVKKKKFFFLLRFYKLKLKKTEPNPQRIYNYKKESNN